MLEAVVRETNEEQCMLVEDLNGHLVQRAEYVAQREELDFLREQLTANAAPEFALYAKARGEPEDAASRILVLW